MPPGTGSRRAWGRPETFAGVRDSRKPPDQFLILSFALPGTELDQRLFQPRLLLTKLPDPLRNQIRLDAAPRARSSGP